jgi:hypothetical protein
VQLCVNVDSTAHVPSASDISTADPQTPLRPPFASAVTLPPRAACGRLLKMFLFLDVRRGPMPRGDAPIASQDFQLRALRNVAPSCCRPSCSLYIGARC